MHTHTHFPGSVVAWAVCKVDPRASDETRNGGRVWWRKGGGGERREAAATGRRVTAKGLAAGEGVVRFVDVRERVPPILIGADQGPRAHLMQSRDRAPRLSTARVRRGLAGDRRRRHPLPFSGHHRARVTPRRLATKPRVRRGRTLSMQVTYSKRASGGRGWGGWLRPPPPPTLYTELPPAAGRSQRRPLWPARRPRVRDGGARGVAVAGRCLIAGTRPAT